jgi:hypothetical protein
MGLITGILTLPLAPVRGTMWIAEVIRQQAENEMADDSELRHALFELEAMRESGELSEEEVQEAEDALLEQLIARGRMGDVYGPGQ